MSLFPWLRKLVSLFILSVSTVGNPRWVAVENQVSTARHTITVSPKNTTAFNRTHSVCIVQCRAAPRTAL
eukprot:CAMPEP_0182544248 /NCGR_PEP_ID=MMETSP1323-20130603/32834_1 /TAXON_ID=236787 /ORGANISM="Florenciella parvula, Strain RCC1693" /LENGTH=69 /DNA_ID=CAMNT_0024755257 /DNA_START=646 /DNA_END=858 /DNA_ORIENTATION=-